MYLKSIRGRHSTIPAVLLSSILSLAFSGNSDAGKKKLIKASASAPKASSSRSETAEAVNTHQSLILTAFSTALDNKILPDLQRGDVDWSKVFGLFLHALKSDSSIKSLESKVALIYELTVYNAIHSRTTRTNGHDLVFSGLVHLMEQLYKAGLTQFDEPESSMLHTILQENPNTYFQMWLANILAAYVNYDPVIGQEEENQQDVAPEIAINGTSQNVARTIIVMQRTLTQQGVQFVMPTFGHVRTNIDAMLQQGRSLLQNSINRGAFRHYNFAEESGDQSLQDYIAFILSELNPDSSEIASGEGEDEVESIMPSFYTEPPRSADTLAANSGGDFARLIDLLHGQYGTQIELECRWDLKILLMFLRLHFYNCDVDGQPLASLPRLRQTFAQFIYHNLWQNSSSDQKQQFIYFFQYVLGFSFIEHLQPHQQGALASTLSAMVTEINETVAAANAQPAEPQTPIQFMMAAMMGSGSGGASGGMVFMPVGGGMGMNPPGGPGGGGSGTTTMSEGARPNLTPMFPIPQAAVYQSGQPPGNGASRPRKPRNDKEIVFRSHGLPTLDTMDTMDTTTQGADPRLTQPPEDSPPRRVQPVYQSPQAHSQGSSGGLTLHTLMTELKSVAAQCYNFGLVLGIIDSDLQTIMRDNHRSEDQLREILRRWLEINPEGTWADIIVVLESQLVKNLRLSRELKVKFGYEIWCQQQLQLQPSYDSTSDGEIELFEVAQILSEMNHDWQNFGLALGLSPGALKTIRADSSNTTGSMREVIISGLNELKITGWHSIVQALHKIGQARIIKRIYDRHGKK